MPCNTLIEGYNIKKMSTRPLVEPASKENKVIGKGKHASSTENRRMVWEKIIWPLILDVNRSYFSLKEYHIKRDQFCQMYNIRPSRIAGGVVSLLIKGILIAEKNFYSLHYRLIPYMRKRVNLEYGLVIREINTKR
ncbi:MAG TPA: hypothetical protein VEL11_09440 [Candidatus Bathyarchaeia archaeon]|nr:hypothetical protein [Candidatus Bathyarchaeia archaeon]